METTASRDLTLGVEATLRNGERVRIRPLCPDDAEQLAAGLERLSPTSRYRRFMTGVEQLSGAEIHRLLDLDGIDHVAFGAELIVDGAPSGGGIGTARYMRLHDDPTAAEFAVTVVDDHHRLGVATAMLDVLAEHARANGIERFTAVMLAENRAVQELIRSRGGDLSTTDEPTIISAVLPL